MFTLDDSMVDLTIMDRQAFARDLRRALDEHASPRTRMFRVSKTSGINRHLEWMMVPCRGSRYWRVYEVCRHGVGNPDLPCWWCPLDQPARPLPAGKPSDTGADRVAEEHRAQLETRHVSTVEGETNA